MSSIAPPIASTATTAATVNFQPSSRISWARARRSRSTGSSAAIGAATRNPTASTARSMASAVVTPGTYSTVTDSVAWLAATLITPGTRASSCSSGATLGA